MDRTPNTLVVLEDTVIGHYVLKDLLNYLNRQTEGICWLGGWCQNVSEAESVVRSKKETVRAIVCDAKIGNDIRAGIRFAAWARDVTGNEPAIVIWSDHPEVWKLDHHTYCNPCDILLYQGDKASSAAAEKAGNLILCWLSDKRSSLEPCWTPSELSPPKRSLLCVGFDYDVEQQLEDSGFRVCPAGVGEEGLDDWKRRVHTLLLISSCLRATYGDEATTEASERLEREAKEAVPDRKEFVVRILPEHGNDVGYILGEINKRVTRE